MNSAERLFVLIGIATFSLIVAIGVNLVVHLIVLKEEPMAEASNSIASLMKANARLKKNAEVAKKVVARKDYSGPAGDVITKFAAKSCVNIDNVPCVILEFRVDGEAPGQENHNNERIAIFNKFLDDDYGTIESRQAEFFERVQLLGIDTRSMTLEQVDKALDELRKDSPQITIRVVKKPGKGANASKTYTNFFISGIAAPAKDDTDYSETDEDVVDDEVVDDVPDDEEVSDEWSDELEDAEDVVDDNADAEFAPSDWIGFEVEYKPAKSPKAMTFKVVDADDAAGTVVLEKDKRKIKALYVDLIFPEAD